MAVVRCLCGRRYNVPDASVGKPVQCAACGRTFVARPASRPAGRPAPKPTRQPLRKARSRRRHRVGELAVARGFVTREQLQACLDYQQALDAIPDHQEHRLGELLVQKHLLSRAQLENLLGEQTDELADAIAEVAKTIPMAPKTAREPEPKQAPKPAVADERRQAIRDSVQVAARQQEKRQGRRALPESPPSRMPRVRPLHAAAGALVALVAVVVYVLRPAPEPLRVLAAYLDSCDERAVQPDNTLAVRDLGLVVRDYGDLRLEPAVTYDFAPDIASANAQGDEAQWTDLLAEGAMSADKQRILGLVIDVIPEEVTPQTIETLEVIVRPAIVGYLSWRRRSAAQFFDGPYRFLLLKIRSPQCNTPWQVASLERLPEHRRPATTIPQPKTGSPTTQAAPEADTKSD